MSVPPGLEEAALVMLLGIILFFLARTQVS